MAFPCMLPSARSLRKAAIALAVIAAALWLRETGWLPDDAPRRPGRNPGNAPARPGDPLPPPAAALQRLDNCTLVEGRGNDGDSFEVFDGARRFTARLYYADCPERYTHSYYGDRVAAQGQYFGGLSADETVRAGEIAREFTLRTLGKAPFTVWTKWERVYDSDRVYAFVRTGDGDLAELLVRAGLARIHTKGSPSPEGRSVQAGRRRLLDLEREARRAGRGAWGMRSRAGTTTPQPGSRPTGLFGRAENPGLPVPQS